MQMPMQQTPTIGTTVATMRMTWPAAASSSASSWASSTAAGSVSAVSASAQTSSMISTAPDCRPAS